MFFSSKTVVTHNGDFHADDVFAVATLKLLNGGKLKVLRSRDPLIWKKGDYIVDVGLEYDSAHNLFDHHQKGGAGMRENGVPYASFGLVWKTYGEAVCGSKQIAERIDSKLVQSIDAMDNGEGVSQPVMADAYTYDIGLFVRSFNPTWKESASSDNRFALAVGEAIKVIERLIVQTRHIFDAESLVVEAYEKAEDKRLIVLEDNIPWQEHIGRFPETIFVVLPRKENGTWGLRTVRKDKGSFDNKKDLPESWAGLQGEEFVRVSGVSDALMCHNGRFVANAKTREGALLLAQKALAA